MNATCFFAGVVVFFVTILDPVSGQDFKPPPGKTPDEALLKEIRAKTKTLGGMLGLLAKQGMRDPGIADVEVYYLAASNIVEHDEFFQKDSAKWTVDILDRGLMRARFLATGELPWTQLRGVSVPRGFRSRLDGSVQPYAFTLPKAYGMDPSGKWPIEVWLHGRNKTLTEVKFLRDHHGEKAANVEAIRIDIYGRGNNAYRWAGEVDVFEALDHFVNNERRMGRGGLVDMDRVILRGFSMGGAGAWHLGLHWPDRWCAVNPGAGFTTTRGYIKALPEKLPYYQEACLHIYDAVDYAENAFNVPIFAYSGAVDGQKLAADLIEKRLAGSKIRMTHIVAPGLAHSYPGEWQSKVKAAMKSAVEAGISEYPSQVHFTTYTLKYPGCQWVEMLGLDKHYERAEVKADRVENGFEVKTKNVRGLRLALPPSAFTPQDVAIDGQKITLRPVLHPNNTFHLYLEKKDGEWRGTLPQRLATERIRNPQKVRGLQGPIDDAFTEPFLCVRGTDKPWHEATGIQAEKRLHRFQKEWSKYFRGVVMLKDDIDVTADDIASRNLILFGDPSSNSLIGHVLDGLPLTWDKKSVTMNGKTYPSSNHLPVLIYPSPLNTNRYVVLNSGHTFHAADFEGTNALLYPRLGDWAVLRGGKTGDEVVDAGLFDDYWRIPR